MRRDKGISCHLLRPRGLTSAPDSAGRQPQSRAVGWKARSKSSAASAARRKVVYLLLELIHPSAGYEYAVIDPSDAWLEGRLSYPE